MLKTELMERTAFRMMSFTGKAPHEDSPGSGAALNVESLAEEVAELLGMQLQTAAAVAEAVA